MANLEHSTIAGDGPASWMNVAAAGLQGIRRFVSDWRRRSTFRQEIAELDRSGNLEIILEDLGLSRSEMDQIARNYPESERLLPQMANCCGIDLGKLDAHVLFDLRHTCSLCPAHRACRQFLAKNDRGAASFCPNRTLLQKLQA